MAMLVIVYSKNSWQNSRAFWIEPNLPGNAGQYLRVLKFASEYGLSFDTRGRECDWSIFSSARNWVTFLDVMDVPRSAWIVPGAAPPFLMMAFSMNCWASSPFSVGQISQWIT